MKKDQHWPGLNFNMTTKIIETKTGYKWTLKVHVKGPDDILNYESLQFESKKECVLNLMSNAFSKAQELVDKAAT